MFCDKVKKYQSTDMYRKKSTRQDCPSSPSSCILTATTPIERKAEKQRQTDKETGGRTRRQTDKCIDKQTAVKQADKQID